MEQNVTHVVNVAYMGYRENSLISHTASNRLINSCGGCSNLLAYSPPPMWATLMTYTQRFSVAKPTLKTESIKAVKPKMNMFDFYTFYTKFRRHM